ncbi:MAG TPA: S9 family peptidase, partial [Thermosynechococcaceae cyanobacterium]
MTSPHISSYGSWKSPISSDLIVAGTIGLGSVRLDGETVYWTELRPTEAGRNVLVQRTSNGQIADVTPAPLNVRTRVHEYGGGSYLVQQGTVYFSNFADQRLYRQAIGAEPIAITPEVAWRYADGVVDVQRQRLICVREDHTGEGEAVNTIVSLSLDGSTDQQILVSGSDFYSSPRLSPDGSCLAWISWNHPDMPWDSTELWMAAISADGTLGEPQQIAGGVNESVVEPKWSPDGVLYFISDRSGCWNLYRWQADIETLCPMEAEFGSPHWVFGISNYAFESATRLICTYSKDGISYLASLDTQTKQLEAIATPYTEIGGIQTAAGRVLFNAGSATEPGVIAQLDLATQKLEVLRRSSSLTIDPG